MNDTNADDSGKSPSGGTGAGSGTQGAAQTQGGTQQPAVAGAQAVGSGNYVVRQGESLLSIALEHGYLPETLWNLPENKKLKDTRKDFSVLLPGDQVSIPKPRPKEETGGDSQRHRFRRKGFPAKLRVQVLQAGEPRKNEPYVLDVDGKLSQGNTDGDGVVEVPIPPDSKRGRLVVGKDEASQQVFDLRLSGLDPVEATSGVQQRLDNLGFPCPPTGELDERTRAALADFQRAFDLDATGEPDQKTRDKLVQVHGS
jgi:N-acetylmuramoyl-L-alanine amidase